MHGPHDEVTIRSPEGVELSLPIAGPAPRMAAYAIDLLLVWVVMIGLVFLFALTLPVGGWLEKWFDRFGDRAPQASRVKTRCCCCCRSSSC
jgi:hypothetical protein